MYKDLNNYTQFKPLNDFEGLTAEQMKANSHEMNLIRAGLVATLSVRVNGAKEDFEMILMHLQSGDTEGAKKVAEWSLNRTEALMERTSTEYAKIGGEPLFG